jgi:SOS-response transcriptional repressor LexA
VSGLILSVGFTPEAKMRLRREAVVDFIRGYQAAHGMPPTVAEIAAHIKRAPSVTLLHYLHPLVEAELLVYSRSVSNRRYRVVDAVCHACGRPV